MSTIQLPRLIDCHVHFREPGYPDKGDMDSESSAATAGGVFTVCEMPNTDPPPNTTERFADKVERAKRIKNCDIRFFFGATEAEHLDALRELFTDPAHTNIAKRCCGLKLFLEHSTGNLKISPEIIEPAFALCAELNIVLVAHCESPEINADADTFVRKSDGFHEDDVSFHSLMRPAVSETKAIDMAINLARTYNTRFHVAHLSTAEGVVLVREAKTEGLLVTCETTPHHLFLSTNDYKTIGTLGKMNPPLRTPDNLPALWTGIIDGTIDCIATDHAPHTVEEKQIQPSLNAPSGVPGVETMLPLLLSVASDQWPHPTSDIPLDLSTFTYDHIVQCCYKNPNHIYSLGKSETPQITIDSSVEWIIHGTDLHSKCGWTPYEGWNVKGKMIRE